MDLSGRTAIVTGSARGIGKAIALKLAEVGADIVVNDIEPAAEAMEETAAEIRALGRRALTVTADVSSPEDVARLINTAAAEYGKIDILVNNAGVTRDQLVMRMSDEEWDTVLNIDLKSAFLCSRAVLRYMLKQRSGRIISIASVVGIMGNAGQANYSAAKAGVIGLTKSIAKEVGSRSITANAIAPGYIQTRMTDQLDEKQTAAMLARIPLNSLGTPRDVAEAVAFLASDEARYITGQVLNIDGGMALG
ncbi:MAG: 3-oxoacyl-[acyl-carrier-protein] reductase [Dehalococcoidales bacterium]|nr:3-oxoacyl-[acyl-carrier-protein] reductase [Dehalococcoidales bacterium]